MLILAIDTSTAAASVAVADEKKLYGEMFTDLKLKHSEKLMLMTDALLKNLRMNISDIDAFAFGKGPGSFTGLRIAAAAVKGFAQPENKPVMAVSSLAATAYMQCVADGFIIAPVFNAQQQSFYTASFKMKNGSLVRLNEDRVEKIDSFEKCFEGTYEKIVFCGDAAVVHRETLGKMFEGRSLFAKPALNYPRASAVAALAQEMISAGEYDSYADVLPNYIRASQAEVNYKVKVK